MEKDDIGQLLQIELDELINNKLIQQLQDNFIRIYWVHSHAESYYNNIVDNYAKIGSFLSNFHDNSSINGSMYGTFNVNNMISHKTITGELRYQAHKDEDRIWTNYIDREKNKFEKDYKKFGIKLDKKLYGNELYKITPNENDIRMQLYTNKLPTNKFKRDYRNEDITGWCDYIECYNKQYMETSNHIIFECPKYASQREILYENVEKLFNNSNERIQN